MNDIHSDKIVHDLFGKFSVPRRPVIEQKKISLPKSVGIIDTNMGLDHALAFVGKVDEVYYCIPSCEGFPVIQNHASGDGFEGLIKVDEEVEAYKDLIIFTDCYSGKTADALRKDGRVVFGPSSEWTRIENDRVYGWKRLKEMGVGVPTGEVVAGMDAALKYIEKNQDGKKVFFIKTSKYRGNKETGSGVMDRTEAMTAITQAGFGPYLTDMEFVIQDMCPGIECGFDAFFSGKNFLRPFLLTLEIKGEGTAGVFIEKNGIEEHIFNKIKKSLSDTNYRGNISFEFFWDGKQVYCHDPTARLPFPCSDIQPKLIKNYPEVVSGVAAGQDVKIKVDQKYCAQVGIYTDDIETWRVIRFPDEIKDSVGFRRVVKRDGNYYFCPGDFLVATAIGSGDTAMEAVEKATEVASQIEASNTTFPGRFADDIESIIQALNSLDGDFKFDSSIKPTMKTEAEVINLCGEIYERRRYLRESMLKNNFGYLRAA